MKKRRIPLVALSTMLLLGGAGLTSCGGNEPVEPKPPVTETVSVASVKASVNKKDLLIGESTKITVTVLPENATDKSYTFKASPEGIVEVTSDGTVKALKEGTATIEVKTTDGGKTDTVTINVTKPAPEVKAPTITLSDKKDLVVAAGTDVALPTFTATDYDGTDLKAVVEVTDLEWGAASISKDKTKFNSNIAGKHIIEYYVYSEKTELEATETIIVNVTPANEDKFDVTGATNPEALKTYGTYKDGFADPYNSYLKPTNFDASYFSATKEESIDGNSLVIDTNKTAGSAAKAIFMDRFSDTFIRDVPVTYEVNFDYKVLEGTPAQFNNFYFGISWDEFDGLNNTFVSTAAKDGSVQHVTMKFPAVSMPAGKKAYFRFFKLSATSDVNPKISVDNFSIKTSEVPNVTNVEPTTKELEAGFTYNWKDKSTGISNGEVAIVNNIEDEKVKTAIKGAGAVFSENVMHLFNADNHLVSGTTANNLVAGKKLQVSFTYYSVNDKGLIFIMMGAGNQASSPTIKDLGNGLKELTWEGTILPGQYQLNIYGQNNPKFDIYLGNMTLKLVEGDVVPEGQTPAGHKVGDKWKVSNRQFDGGNQKGHSWNLVKDQPKGELVGEKLPEKVSKVTFTKDKEGADANIEWFQSKNTLEIGQEYKITFVYYVEANVGDKLKIHFNMDNNVFIDLAQHDPDANKVGYHEFTLNWKATKTVDFFSFYMNSFSAGSIFDIGYLEYELIKINK